MDGRHAAQGRRAEVERASAVEADRRLEQDGCVPDVRDQAQPVASVQLAGLGRDVGRRVVQAQEGVEVGPLLLGDDLAVPLAVEPVHHHSVEAGERAHPAGGLGGDVHDARRDLQRHRRLANDRRRAGLDRVDGLDLDHQQPVGAMEGGHERTAVEPQLDVVAALHPVAGAGGVDGSAVRRRRPRAPAAHRSGRSDAEPRADVGRGDDDLEGRLGDGEQHAMGLDGPRDVDRLGRAVVEVDRGRPELRHRVARANVANTAAAASAAASISASVVSRARAAARYCDQRNGTSAP